MEWRERQGGGEGVWEQKKRREGEVGNRSEGR